MNTYKHGKPCINKAVLVFTILCTLTFFFTSCGKKEILLLTEKGFEQNGKPIVYDSSYVRENPELLMPQNNIENALIKNENGVSGAIDFSNAANGYIAASCISNKKVVIKISYENNSNEIMSYIYSLNNTGIVEYFPLPLSNSTYYVQMYLHIENNSYELFMDEAYFVLLESEFMPFMLPNQLVWYESNSPLVEFSYALSKNCKTDLEVIQQIVYWFAQNITYDKNTAAKVIDGTITSYIPLPNNVYLKKSGICFDYASLFAAMCRINGIPCKLVQGYAINENSRIKHAWNEVWLENIGWVTVKIPSKANDWLMIDTTFETDEASSYSITESLNYYATSYH